MGAKNSSAQVSMENAHPDCSWANVDRREPRLTSGMLRLYIATKQQVPDDQAKSPTRDGSALCPNQRSPCWLLFLLLLVIFQTHFSFFSSKW